MSIALKGFLVFSILVVLTLCFAGCACRNIDNSQVQPFLRNTESWVMVSKNNNTKYQISVALPHYYDDVSEKFHVIYGMDANMDFGTLVESVRHFDAEGTEESTIVVGIGYPDIKSGPELMRYRSNDLTPTHDPVWNKKYNKVTAKYNVPQIKKTGGAEHFADFIENELVPVIENKYQVKKDDRAFYGHSFGGLFGVYLLLHREDLFDRYIIGSPSLWWDNGISFKYLDDFMSSDRKLKGSIFISVGSLEEGAPEVEKDAMVTNLNEFVDLLVNKNYEGLKLHKHIFENEGHISVIPVTITHGVRFLFH